MSDYIPRLRLLLEDQLKHVISYSKENRGLVLASVGGCLVVLRLLYKKYQSKIYKHPPQLYGLPIIGSLFTMLSYKKRFHSELLPSYGDIVQYNVATLCFYTLNDLELINKVLQKALDRQSKRFVDNYVRYGCEPNMVTINDDRDWSFRRKTLMRGLTLLMNSTKVEETISKVCQNMTFKELDSVKAGQLWYSRKYTRNAAFNIIFLATHGRTLEANSDKYNEYVSRIDFYINKTFVHQFSKLFPKYLANLLFNNIRTQFGDNLLAVLKRTEEDLNETLNNNNNNNISNNNETETLAQYIVSEYQKHNNNKMDEITKKRVVSDLHVLIIAGLDTTGHSTNIGILLLAKYPNVQETVYKELFDICGDDDTKLFKLSKLNQCPQFRAFINETLRIANAVPHGVPRTCDKDLRCMKYKNGKILVDITDSKIWNDNNSNNNNSDILYDYIIKSDTLIEPNLEYVNQCNKASWNLDNDPMTLNLNYWLVKDEESGKITFKNNSNSIPFSVGGRNCAGISLAMKNVAAFMANIILNYQIIAPNNDPANMKIEQKTFGLSTASLEYEPGVLVTKRSTA